jgi:hypothetical protein
MPRAELTEMLRPLPYSLRERVEGYVTTVAAEAPGIFEQADVPLTPEVRDDFLFLCGVRKLWAIVDAEFHMLTGSLSLLHDQGVEEVRVGNSIHARGSETYAVVRNLRNGLQGELIELGIFSLIRTQTLIDLLLGVAYGQPPPD